MGNYIVLGDTVCLRDSPNHYNLALSFLLFGYIYVGVPIIIFAALCLCLPMVLLLYYLMVNRNEG